MRGDIVFNPCAGPKGARIIHNSTEQGRLSIPGDASRTGLNPIVICQIYCGTIRRPICGAKDAQFHALNGSIDATSIKADITGLPYACIAIRLKIG